MIEPTNDRYAASSAQKKVITEALVLDNILSSSSPRLKSPSIRRPKDGLGSWSTLFQRHRFLLSALVLLTILCTVYLYFAITIGSGSYSGLSGAQKASCHMELVKDSISNGKLKFL
ncbi:unnamed protein product [Vicia faba]|uniref:Uncharacterized protein n=1 Tax=Vicia faba TaxID=3906 RepID=A0AAV1A6T3_VICFA|nr:unnamed protein product [Vicia faba]